MNHSRWAAFPTRAESIWLRPQAGFYNSSKILCKCQPSWINKEYRPAALLKPASDVVPHVVRFKGVEQKVGCFDQFCSLLVFTKFTRKGEKKRFFVPLHNRSIKPVWRTLPDRRNISKRKGGEIHDFLFSFYIWPIFYYLRHKIRLCIPCFHQQ